MDTYDDNGLNLPPVSAWRYFKFKAATIQSERFIEVIAPDEESARFGVGAVRAEEVTLVPMSGVNAWLAAKQMGTSVIQEEIKIFWENMATLADSRTEMVASIAQCTISAKTPYFRGVLGTIIKAFRSDKIAGSRAYEAFALFPDAFDAVSVGMVASASSTGDYSTVYRLNAAAVAAAGAVAHRVRGAIFEPAFLFFAGGIIASFILFIQLPKVAEQFTAMGNGELPPLTQFLLDFVNACKSPLVVLVIGIPVFLFLKRAAIVKSEPFQRLILKLPKIGDLVRDSALSRGVRVLMMQSAARQPANVMFHAASRAAGNIVVRDYFKAVLSALESQRAQTTDEAFGQEAWRVGNTGLLIASQAEIGAATGDMAGVYGRISADLDTQVSRRLDNAIPYIGKAGLLLTMGMFSVVIIGTLLPMVGMNDGTMKTINAASAKK